MLIPEIMKCNGQIAIAHAKRLIESGARASDIGTIILILHRTKEDKLKDLEIPLADGFQGRQKESIIKEMIRLDGIDLRRWLAEVLLEIFVQRREKTNTRSTDGRRAGQNLVHANKVTRGANGVPFLVLVRRTQSEVKEENYIQRALDEYHIFKSSWFTSFNTSELADGGFNLDQMAGDEEENEVQEFRPIGRHRSKKESTSSVP
ncbi:hypothetical protein Tco_0588475 [Tanacetum coccineum]